MRQRLTSGAWCRTATSCWQATGTTGSTSSSTRLRPIPVGNAHQRLPLLRLRREMVHLGKRPVVVLGRAQAEVSLKPSHEPVLQQRVRRVGRWLDAAEASGAGDHLVVDGPVALQPLKEHAHRLLGLDAQGVALRLELLETLAGEETSLLASAS